MPGSTILRQQLRFLREPRNAEPVLKVLPRFAAQGATGFVGEAGPQSIGGPSSVAGGGGVSAVVFFAEAGWSASRSGGGEAEAAAAAEPVHDVQEARGAHGVQVQVWDDAVWDPPLPGAARVRVRLQGAREGADREGEPGDQGREAREDLREKGKGIVIISSVSIRLSSA